MVKKKEVVSRQDDPHDIRLETRLWLRILRIHGNIFAALNRALKNEVGLSLARFDVLAQLDHYPEGISLGELSKHLQVTGGNLSGLVKSLEADAYIVREMSAVDRRSFLVAITDKGRSVFEQALTVHRRELSDAFGAVDRALLLKCLEDMNRLQEEIRG